MKKILLAVLGSLSILINSCNHRFTPVPGCAVLTCTNEHAFLFYSGFNNYLPSNSAEVFREELNKTLNSQITHLEFGGKGFSVSPTVQNPGSIYFLSDSGGTRSNNLYIINNDGTSLKPVLPNAISTNLGIVSASVSPNGQYIAFIYFNPVFEYAPSSLSFAVYNLTTNKLTQLGEAYSHCDWAKDGSKIYFDLNAHVSHIYSISPDGTGRTQLTSSAFGEDYPAVSPDGKTLAISSTMDAGGNENEIGMINIDGTNLRAITHLGGTAIAREPGWSPVGDEIFFTFTDRTKTAVPPHIYSTNLTGTAVSQFTSGNGETNPFVAYSNY